MFATMLLGKKDCGKGKKDF